MSLLAKHVMLLRTVATWPARLPRNCELLCRHANVAISSRMQLQSTLVNKCNSTCVEQSNEGPTLIPPEDLLEATDPETWKDLAESFRVYRNFVTEDEEKSLFDEVEPYLKRLKYETSHWDDVCSHLCYFALLLSKDAFYIAVKCRYGVWMITWVTLSSATVMQEACFAVCSTRFLSLLLEKTGRLSSFLC